MQNHRLELSVSDAVRSEMSSFRVSLYNKGRNTKNPVDPEKFYESLRKSLEKDCIALKI